MSTKTTKDEALARVKSAFGFVPNLMATGLEGGLLKATEKQVVMLAVSAFNECHYRVA